MLLIASPLLAGVVLIGVTAVLLISRLLARLLVRRAEVEQQRLAEAIGSATDLITGLRVLKGIGAERAAADRYRTLSQAALGARLHAARLEGGYYAGTGVLTGIFLVVVAWVGGRLALAGTISVGELVAALGLAQFLVEPLERLTLSVRWWRAPEPRPAGWRRCSPVPRPWLPEPRRCRPRGPGGWRYATAASR